MYVITDWEMGGAQLQLVRMCQYMRMKENKVILMSMIPSTSEELKRELKNLNVKYYSLNMTRGKASVSSYLKFIRIAKAERPDVIHSHMIHANLLLRAASVFLHGCKKINTIHGEEEYLGKRKLIYRVTDRMVHYTVCCGEILFKQAKQNKIVSDCKLRYICNSLNTNDYVYDKTAREDYRKMLGVNHEFVWITVGRLCAVKNQEYLLKELQNVIKEIPDTKLILVGDGPLKNDLESLTKELGLKDNVIFVGKRNDVVEYLSAADAFVLSSKHEGLPLSLQEAGAVGLPLVSTDVGGCNEMIVEGKNGFLCESDTIGSLSKAMILLAKKNKEERKVMGEYSRDLVVKKFDMSDVMKKWEALYE